MKGSGDKIELALKLIPDQDWVTAIESFPGDYQSIAKSLNLPVEVVLCRARASVSPEGVGQVELTPEARDLLGKDVKGSGGLQCLLRKLQAHVVGNMLSLNRREFDRIGIYLVSLTGGGKARLSAVMKCAKEGVVRAGGLSAFFAASGGVEVKGAPRNPGGPDLETESPANVSDHQIVSSVSLLKSFELLIEPVLKIEDDKGGVPLGEQPGRGPIPEPEVEPDPADDLPFLFLELSSHEDVPCQGFVNRGLRDDPLGQDPPGP